MKFDFPIEFNQEKNVLLKETRKVDFYDINEAIKRGKILDDLGHKNKKRYPNQRILVVQIQSYAYAVSYVIDKKRKVAFLKTLYPSRQLTKKYLKRGER